eukprot:235989-Amphidinium_carterae.1
MAPYGRLCHFCEELRNKQKHFAEHDDKLLREAASLQLQGDDLRRQPRFKAMNGTTRGMASQRIQQCFECSVYTDVA